MKTYRIAFRRVGVEEGKPFDATIIEVEGHSEVDAFVKATGLLRVLCGLSVTDIAGLEHLFMDAAAPLPSGAEPVMVQNPGLN